MNKPSENILKLIEKSPQISVQDLLECLDPESIYKLMMTYGGETIFIPKIDKVLKMERNEKIKNDFNAGLSQRQLVKKYGITARYLRKLLTEIEEWCKTTNISTNSLLCLIRKEQKNKQLTFLSIKFIKSI